VVALTERMNIVGLSGRAGVGKDTVADVLVKEFGYVKVSFADPLKRCAMELWSFTEEQLWGPSEMRNEPDPRWPKDHIWGRRDFDETGMFTTCNRCGIKGALVPYDAGPNDINGADNPPKDATEPCVHLSPREALQFLGTEVARSIHEQTWTTYLLRIAEKLLTNGGWYSPTKGWAWSRINESGFNHVGPGKYTGVVTADVRFPNEANTIKRAGGRMWLIDRPGIGLTGRAGSHSSETSMDGYEYDAVLRNGPLETIVERVKEIL
jgi:hypothetical protein